MLIVEFLKCTNNVLNLYVSLTIIPATSVVAAAVGGLLVTFDIARRKNFFNSENELKAMVLIIRHNSLVLNKKKLLTR